MDSALARIGLAGSYQAHVAPLWLVPDRRAHQTVSGFSAEEVRAFAERFGAERVWLFHGDEKSALRARDLSKVHEGDVVVIAATSDEDPGGLYGLVWLVDRLLGPGGCPWDQEQTHESLKRHMIEEAYELCQAIDDHDDEKLKEELGDVLLQPVMHAQMRRRDGSWDVDEVARAVVEKLVRRHPHVFGAPSPHAGRGKGEGTVGPSQITADQVLKNWDEIKKKEGKGSASVLEGVPRAMPALLRAYEVSKRAARSGFEWPNVEGVWEKLREEERELRDAVSANDPDATREEIGDLLFTVVNLARWAGVEPEEALARMLDRFTRRFQAIERAATKPLRELNPQEWDDLWESAKSSDRLGSP